MSAKNRTGCSLASATPEEGGCERTRHDEGSGHLCRTRAWEYGDRERVTERQSGGPDWAEIEGEGDKDMETDVELGFSCCLAIQTQ